MPERFQSVLVLSTFLAFGIAAAAQERRADFVSVDGPTQLITLGQSSVPLSGPWKFQIGDSPVDPTTGRLFWVEPAFDDAQWGTIDLTPLRGAYDPTTGTSGYIPGWNAQGHRHSAGYGWYRLRMNVRSENQGAPAQLALEMPAPFDDAYQVYANGQLIGEFGKFTVTGVKFNLSQPRAFLLPTSNTEGSVTLAIRMWMDPATTLDNPAAGGLHQAPVLGQAPTIFAMQFLARKAVLRYLTSYFIEAVILVLALGVAFALYWLDRSEPAYLLLGLLCSSLLLYVVNFVANHGFTWYDVGIGVFLSTVLYNVTASLWPLFWAYWFRLGKRRLLHLVVWPIALLAALQWTLLGPHIYGRVLPLSAGPWLWHFYSVFPILFSLVLVGVIAQCLRKNRVEGMLALPAILLVVLARLMTPVLSALHLPTSFRPFGTFIPIGQLGSIVSLIMITVLLLRRFFAGLRQREQLRQEMERARTVQNILVPQEVPTVPGFRIQALYKPAGEVGGDFFQILPLERGGVLVVIGDVSGKGMPAAMTVSLLVGTVRTLAHFTQSPGEILAAMNQRMLTRSQGGFTTCLALRADADGTLTVANAGHIAPYLDGHELDLENGLPLGLAHQSAYIESKFTLGLHKQLTLLTDGVVEARSKAGELLGFDRAAAISTEPAEKVVSAAQAIGQDDDITVVTLLRVDEDAVAVSRAAASAVSPSLA